jgi:hypothetical protein
MLAQNVMQSLKVFSADVESRCMPAALTEYPQKSWKVCELERNNVLLEPGHAAGSLELEREGDCAMGCGVTIGAEADAEAEAVEAAALVVGTAVVLVTIPVAVVAPDVAVAMAVVAGTGEFPVALIEEKPEDVEGRLDEAVVDDEVGSTGAGVFAALNPNINPNPNPSASARIINTANPHKT